MYCTARFCIIFSALQPIEHPTQVDQRSVLPICTVDDLQFQIQANVIVQCDINVQNKLLIFDLLPKDYWICDLNRFNIRLVQM